MTSIFRRTHVAWVVALSLAVLATAVVLSRPGPRPAVAGADAGAKALPPRMRGTNVHIGVNDVNPATEIPRWASWKVNTVRALLNVDRDASPPTSDDPLAPYAANLAKLDAIVAESRTAGMKVIVSAHEVWGRNDPLVFWDPVAGRTYRDQVVAFWSALATRYRSDPTVVGYDVINEPGWPSTDPAVWYRDLLPKLRSAIRAVDTATWLVVEPTQQAGPSGLVDLPVWSDRRVLYSFHDYAPRTFTVQGVSPNCPLGPVYPGSNAHPYCVGSATRTWDKAQLRAFLKPAVDFRRQRGGRIYVGEFSAARWAPGAAQWLKDQIALFERHGFDWTFLGTANYNGFNPTFGPDAPVSGLAYGGQTTDRLNVLLDGWRRNTG